MYNQYIVQHKLQGHFKDKIEALYTLVRDENYRTSVGHNAVLFMINKGFLRG